jgi:hypothetical protein
VLVVALVLVGLAATGCFEIGEVAVENNTGGDLILWTSQVECDGPLRGNSPQTILAPGERETVIVIETDFAEFETCIAVAQPGFRSSGGVLTHEVERGTLYVVTSRGTVLQVAAAGPHEEEFSFSFRVSRTVLLILGLPALAGAIVAVIVSIKFFVDWGKRPQTGVS